jgi:hypothetical protein
LLEELITNPAVQAGLMVVGRNLFGWFQSAFSDKKISPYEWKQLGKTVITMGLMSAGIYFGLGTFTNVDVAESTALAGLIDVLRSNFKKK